MPPEGRDLVLAGALLSIALNPLAFAGIKPLMAWLKVVPGVKPDPEPGLPDGQSVGLRDHVILVGYGRVGGFIGPALIEAGVPFVVIENSHRLVDTLQEQGIPVIYGDASAPGVLEAANVAHARLIAIATPDGIQARHILDLSRKARPGIDTIVRTHSDSERERLEQQGVGRVVMGERELARGMLKYALQSLGIADDRMRQIVERATLARQTSMAPKPS
jgi:CPA2 family monovalent cation:H+ antiporter-2